MKEKAKSAKEKQDKNNALDKNTEPFFCTYNQAFSKL